MPSSSVRGRARFAELHAHSSFSFLDGASSPAELVDQAADLGLSAVALTDHDGLYGVVEFADAARAAGMPVVFGAELGIDGQVPASRAERATAARVGAPDPAGRHLLVLARNPTGYSALSRVIGEAQLAGESKGRPVYDPGEITQAARGDWLILTGCRKGTVRAALESSSGVFGLDPARRALAGLVDRFGRDNVVVELTYAQDPHADERFEVLAGLAAEARLPVVATTGAHYHHPGPAPAGDGAGRGAGPAQPG